MTSQALGGGEFALRLVSRQRVAPLYWRSDTHTHTHTQTPSRPLNFVVGGALLRPLAFIVKGAFIVEEAPS